VGGREAGEAGEAREAGEAGEPAYEFKFGKPLVFSAAEDVIRELQLAVEEHANYSTRRWSDLNFEFVRSKGFSPRLC